MRDIGSTDLKTGTDATEPASKKTTKHKTMKAKLFFVKAFIAMIFMTMTISVSSCSKDDGDNPEVPVLPENPDYEGDEETFSLVNTTWTYNDYDEDETYQLKFNKGGKGKFVIINEYGESSKGFKYSVKGYDITIKIKDNEDDVEFSYVVQITTKDGRHMIELEGEEFYLEGESSGDGGSSQKDALSNTSWKLKSVTGWGEDEYSSYRTLGLEFGSNGKVKETNNGESTSGTYSLSGTKISFDGISFTNAFGSTFDYKLSGSSLTLTADKGTNMETVLTFTKK